MHLVYTPVLITRDIMMQPSRDEDQRLEVDDQAWRQLFLDILPATPDESRFRKEEFVNELFSVDNFVKRHRKELPLEKLREYLSLYLKRIRLARNDLINQDYTDFVNLSTNLVGLNKSINILTHPLMLTKSDVSQVKSDFSEILNSLNEKMNILKQVRKDKRQMQRLLDTSSSISKLEDIVRLKLTADESLDSQSNFTDFFTALERVVVDLRHSKRTLLKTSKDLPLRESLVSRTNILIQRVAKTCDDVLSKAVETQDIGTLDFMIRIYEQTGDWPVLSQIT